MDYPNANALRNAEEGAAMNEGQHYFVYSSQVTIPAGVGSKIQDEIKIQSDSYFDIQRIYVVDNGAFKVSLKDSYLNYAWQSDPVHRDNLCGTPEFPAFLLDPVLMPPNTSIFLEYENLVAGANALQLVLEGSRRFGPKFPSDAELSDRSRKRWFQYVYDVTLPANSIKTFVEQINADSFFLCKKLMAVKTGDAALRMAISTLGNRNLSDRRINLDNIFGRALRPNALPKNQRIPLGPNSTVQFEAEDLSGADNDIQLCFEGVKSWRRA